MKKVLAIVATISLIVNIGLVNNIIDSNKAMKHPHVSFLSQAAQTALVQDFNPACDKVVRYQYDSGMNSFYCANGESVAVQFVYEAPHLNKIWF